MSVESIPFHYHIVYFNKNEKKKHVLFLLDPKFSCQKQIKQKKPKNFTLTVSAATIAITYCDMLSLCWFANNNIFENRGRSGILLIFLPSLLITASSCPKEKLKMTIELLLLEFKTILTIMSDAATLFPKNC